MICSPSDFVYVYVLVQPQCCGALHAELGQHVVHPDLALARDRDLEVVLVVGIAALLAQRLGAALAELRDVLAIVGRARAPDR